MMSDRSSDGGLIARAARARALQTDASPAADLLGFYAALVEYQQRLVEQWNGSADETAPAYVVSGFSRTSGSLLHAIDSEWVGRAVRDFILWLVRLPSTPLREPRATVEGLKPDATNATAIAPSALRSSADAMRDVAEEEWRHLFESYRANSDEAVTRFGDAPLFALEAVLQPIAEHLVFVRGVRLQPDRGSGGRTHSRCPACGGAPVVGVLREEGHGARRRLVCGLCFTEWDYLRVVCVKCGERRFDALPVFTAEQFFQARVEACDTCRSYLKTIDATKDGRVVPVVDDLATVALDLWAREQGYTRVRPNLVRI